MKRKIMNNRKKIKVMKTVEDEEEEERERRKKMIVWKGRLRKRSIKAKEREEEIEEEEEEVEEEEQKEGQEEEEESSGYWLYTDDEDVQYTGMPWCAPVKVKHGYISCQSPHGEHYKNVLGTRCKIRCKTSYEMHGSSENLCMASKLWSGNYACRGLTLPFTQPS
ncbi:sushi repeat-containing protein SRPX-like [Xyrauchen texanus]|uniref:sushi repeat-containing protein SRPX-like n=1 Tax=Xyrauchen texanus TaxID=154827 RepID=UPI002241F653|nr:sushi repeat-containing protein SRPX-like [Xyrauchen texanus]